MKGERKQHSFSERSPHSEILVNFGTLSKFLPPSTSVSPPTGLLRGVSQVLLITFTIYSFPPYILAIIHHLWLASQFYLGVSSHFYPFSVPKRWWEERKKGKEHEKFTLGLNPSVTSQLNPTCLRSEMILERCVISEGQDEGTYGKELPLLANRSSLAHQMCP